jgi:hypothetical protein
LAEANNYQTLMDSYRAGNFNGDNGDLDLDALWKDTTFRSAF